MSVPESIDYASIGPQLLHALERRHSQRRGEELPRPIPALVIARRFGIRPHGSNDSRKRGVRLVIDQLRQDGAPIQATFGGYYLAGCAADWERYREFRRRLGLAHLAAAATVDRQEAHADAQGQLALFSGPAKAAR